MFSGQKLILVVLVLALSAGAAPAQARKYQAHNSSRQSLHVRARARLQSAGYHLSPGSHFISFSGLTCVDANLIPTADNLPQVSLATLCLINQDRTTNGLRALAVNAKLNLTAQGHIKDQVEQNYFAHISPVDGSTPQSRMENSGYLKPGEGYTIGENLAWGSLSLATPEAIVESWMNSPEHRANILDPQYLETGIGVANALPATLAIDQPGALYAEDFGAIEHSS